MGGGAGQGGSGESSGEEEAEEEEPVEPTKSPRQICLESTEVIFQFCRQQAHDDYDSAFLTECNHLGTGTGSVGVITLGEDYYAKCKDRITSAKESHLVRCDLVKSINIQDCPAG